MVLADSKVKDSIRHQTPLLTRSPNARAAEDIEAITQFVQQFLEDAQQAMAK